MAKKRKTARRGARQSMEARTRRVLLLGGSMLGVSELLKQAPTRYRKAIIEGALKLAK